jgi:ribosomal-protein-alanine N-acetyltransferase
MLTLNFNPFPTLTTERLILREVVVDDHKEIFFLRSDAGILKYLDKEPSPSINEAVEHIEKISNLIRTNESILWGITLKDNPKVIGTICFWQMIKEHFRAELGYALHPNHHGKGIMHEAITAVLDYGFTQMKLHSIEAKVNVANEASIKILERNNFVREGYFKEDYYFNGKFLDTGVYSLLTPVR